MPFLRIILFSKQTFLFHHIHMNGTFRDAKFFSGFSYCSIRVYYKTCYLYGSFFYVCFQEIALLQICGANSISSYSLIARTNIMSFFTIYMICCLFLCQKLIFTKTTSGKIYKIFCGYTCSCTPWGSWVMLYHHTFFTCCTCG